MKYEEMYKLLILEEQPKNKNESVMLFFKNGAQILGYFVDTSLDEKQKMENTWHFIPNYREKIFVVYADEIESLIITRHKQQIHP